MESVWNSEVNFRKREALSKDIECDILVIGAGMAGLLTAYMLTKSGREVVVIDAKSTASGVTKNTTAKITCQHDLIYDSIIKEFGEEGASQYFKANQLAIEKYKEIIDEENIDCDFERKDAYVYSVDNTKSLEDEYIAAKKLGIDAELVDEVNLPFKVKGALKFKNQAQFNPLKFLQTISEKLTIYENTTALDITEEISVVTKDDIKIKANKIIVATHYPFLNTPGYYFMRMHQERSYVLALENAQDVNGMYKGIDKNAYSFRNYKNLLIFGGAAQRAGENEEGGAYEKLRKAAKEFYPNSIEKYHWSAQDCMTLDNIPYIGHYSSKTPDIYVETGFKKWGMTTSMVAAMIISDMILGKENDFSEIFSPGRFDMSASMKNAANDLMITAKNFIAQRIDIPEESLESIQRGHGGIVEYNGQKTGVYKDNDGKVFAVSTKCAHLECELHWNDDELTWDCPCHGSRYDYKGNWIESPTNKSLDEI
ncbi:FAD-dependent oxidoreductase [Clostridium saccharobutylicum]|uniref:Putative rieske 2Fe-2S iron-sulfur protein YhfW n=1 Tax=Clostridium saccharobutylicum DSM 13864 TaxID=1345695 RepID=U5MU07_CLOSA|nr:FAD-dependent oxidoreductase [Clostridium saccharobutylicum]AGX44008.1 putative rieske 2Fe-2S iron-sulfur protein YhfW [Clostridium saccharobutylicum DSM 13864]AQR91300.1 gamma-glutamylputrescine oxidoreductase [Clostridium saccharobutylicum]AQS01204.1 gamma-glutamylputrescine oxidoreductase [Clostridium saccharobutylicum]AQS15187.1 gamma-glutamylputrescine oxidoreductase [Clostridium saccharobutylicum]MBA2905317.1 glycine/D-amino acid oxidase-like deaminating enzyme/nitrite reductase/ring-